MRFEKLTEHQSSTSQLRPCKNCFVKPGDPSPSRLSPPTDLPHPPVIFSFELSLTTTRWTMSLYRVPRQESRFRPVTSCKSFPRMITIGGRQEKWQRQARQDLFLHQNCRFDIMTYLTGVIMLTNGA